MVTQHGRALSCALALVVAGCSSASESESEDTNAKAPVAGTTLAPGSIRLTGEDISVSGPLGTTLAFGSARDTVDKELIAELGKPVSRSQNDECGAGPMQFSEYANGLTLNFQNGKFVGWASRKGDEGVATARGLRVGSPRGMVAALRGYEPVLQSSLGEEFTIKQEGGGAITGFYGDEGVSQLQGGINCNFR